MYYLLLFVILLATAIMYINLVSSATNCQRQSDNSENPKSTENIEVTKNTKDSKFTLMYVHLVLAVILVLIAISFLYMSFYSNI